MVYLNSYKDQNWLVPQSIKDMSTKGHVCFFVEEFVESLDFSNFNELYDGAGHPEGINQTCNKNKSLNIR